MKIKGRRIIAVAIALAMAGQPVAVMAEEVGLDTTAVQVEDLDNADMQETEESTEFAEKVDTETDVTDDVGNAVEEVGDNDAKEVDAEETDAKEVDAEETDVKEADVEEADVEEADEADVEETDVEEIAEADLEADGVANADADYREIDANACVNVPRMVWTRCSVDDYETGRITYELENENEDICSAEIVSTTYEDYIRVEGKKVGTAVLDIKLNGEIVEKVNVHINEKPDDAVDIEDIWLRSELLYEYNGYDRNKDGSLSEDEMENIEYLYLAQGENEDVISIKSLNGLEYAKYLYHIELSGNKELTNIDALFKLRESEQCYLTYIGLDDTNVSDDDRWKLADIKDTDLVKSYYYDPNLGRIFGDDLKIEIISGKDYVDLVDSIYISSTPCVLGKEIGTARLKLSYNGKSTEINVNVDGIAADQPLGEESDNELHNISGKLESAITGYWSYYYTNFYLDNYGNLWSIGSYKNKELISENVKDCLYYILYTSGSQEKKVEYILDADDALCTMVYEENEWGGHTFKGLEKLVENVVKCDARYALDKNGILHNIYNSADEEIADVIDWTSTVNSDGPVVYILKNDGTLWTRAEVDDTENVNTLTQFTTGVKQVTDNGYVKNDGTFMTFAGEKVDFGIDTGVGKIVDLGYGGGNLPDAFYGLDGNFYADCKSSYINCGELNVKDLYNMNYSELYILTVDGNVYKYDEESGEVILFLADVSELNEEGIRNTYSEDTEDTEYWSFKLNDGTYLNKYGQKMSRVKLASTNGRPADSGAAYLIANGEGESYIEREGIRLLDNVKQLLSNMAVRTDGTVWYIWDIPKKVASIAIGKLATSITLNETNVELKLDDEITLSETIEPVNVSNTEVEWESSDTNVAEVYGGYVYAVGVGTATITCTVLDGSGISASCTVKVTGQTVKVSSVSLNKENITLKKDAKATLTATVAPKNATDKTVTWSSSNEKIATVDSNGKVTAVGKGTATITAAANDGSGKKGTCKVTVELPVKKITLNKSTASVLKGKTLTLEVKSVSPSNANNKKVTWSSSNKSVATVDKNGKVTTKKAGKATITCTAADGSKVTAKCTVTVKQPVTKITLKKTKVTLKKGKTVTLKKTVTPSSAATKTVTWKSSNKKVATVDKNGKVKAVGKGTATITCTAKDGSKVKATCKITVTK